MAVHQKGAGKLPSTLEIECSGRTPEDLVKMGIESKRGGEARRLFAVAAILRGAAPAAAWANNGISLTIRHCFL